MRPDVAENTENAGKSPFRVTKSSKTGRIAEEKALDIVIRGFAQAIQNGTNVRLLIVGGGPDMGFSGKGAKRHPDASKFPTVIEGKVENGKLRIISYNLMTGTVLDDLSFGKRKKR